MNWTIRYKIHGFILQHSVIQKMRAFRCAVTKVIVRFLSLRYSSD
jgi:hypothetical protein